MPELFKLRPRVVGNKGLVAAALSLAQTLVAKVLLKLGEKDLVRVRKARRIVLKHARARKHDPRVEVVALAYPRALARLGEQPRVSDLQHAVRKGAHLHWAKAGIGVLQAKTPQTEPLCTGTRGTTSICDAERSGFPPLGQPCPWAAQNTRAALAPEMLPAGEWIISPKTFMP